MTSADGAEQVAVGMYVERSIAQRARTYAREANLTLSGVVEAALLQYLDTRSDEWGSPVPGTDPAPTRHRHRGRPTRDETEKDRTWQAAWRERMQRRSGRPIRSPQG